LGPVRAAAAGSEKSSPAASRRGEAKDGRKAPSGLGRNEFGGSGCLAAWGVGGPRAEARRGECCRGEPVDGCALRTRPSKPPRRGSLATNKYGGGGSATRDRVRVNPRL